MKEIWNQITDKLKSEVNEASLNLFLSSIQPGKFEDNTFYLEAVNDICREWIERKYQDILRKILQSFNPGVECVFVTQSRKKTYSKPIQLGFQGVAENEENNLELKKSRKKPASPKEDEIFNSKYMFDSFVVGKSNQFAHAICLGASKSIGTLYNPIFIYGGVGLGKTHLIQAFGQEVLSKNSGAKVAYLHAENFTNEYIDSLKENKANAFRTKYRKKDVLLIDDVQFFAGKERILEEFFHTFNDLFQNKKQIILTSDSPPKMIHNLDARITSRFEMGIVADVQSPDLETRVAILKSAAERSLVTVSDDILMYLAQNVTTNIRELEGAFFRIIAYAGIVEKAIDRDLVDQILKDFFHENSVERISIQFIQKKVAEFYDIPAPEMKTKRRTQTLVFPRQVAMKLSQMLVEVSLSQIGQAFGGRDHTTVIHAIEKINKMLTNGFAEEFERVKKYVIPQKS